MDFYLSGSWIDEFLSNIKLRIVKCSDRIIMPQTNANTPEDKLLIENFEKDLRFINSAGNIHDKKFNQDLNFFDKMRQIENNWKTQKSVNCKSEEEIEMILEENYWINIVNQYIKPNPKNYKNPLKIDYGLDYYLLGNGFYKYVDYFFDNYILETDKGIIFNENQLEDNKIGIGEIKPDFVLKMNNHLLIEINFYMSNIVHITSRSYIKLQILLANLGGFIKLTILIFSILSSPFFDNKNNIKIINELYQIEDIDNINLNREIIDKTNKINSNRYLNEIYINNNNNNINNISNIKLKEIKEKKKNDSNQLKIDYKNLKEIRTKMKFTNIEIFRSTYSLICCNKELKKKMQSILLQKNE